MPAARVLTLSIDTTDSNSSSKHSALFADNVRPCAITASAPVSPMASHSPDSPLQSTKPCSLATSTLTPMPSTKGFFRHGSVKVRHQLAKAKQSASLSNLKAKLTPRSASRSLSPQPKSFKNTDELERAATGPTTASSPPPAEKPSRKNDAKTSASIAGAQTPGETTPKPEAAASTKKSTASSPPVAVAAAAATTQSGAVSTSATTTTTKSPPLSTEVPEVVEQQHRDPNRVLLSSTISGMSPYELIGMILDKRFEVVMRKHKPAMGHRTLLKEGEYKPAKAPWHKEKGKLLIVHANKPESILTKVMRTAHAVSYIKVPDDCNASSKSITGSFKVIVPKFKRVDVHGDMTITQLDDGRITVATDVYLKLNIPLIGNWVANFLRAQMKVGYQILPTLVADYLEYPQEQHPLETMKFD